MTDAEENRAIIDAMLAKIEEINLAFVMIKRNLAEVHTEALALGLTEPLGNSPTGVRNAVNLSEQASSEANLTWSTIFELSERLKDWRHRL